MNRFLPVIAVLAAILPAILLVPASSFAQQWPDVSGRWAQKQVTASVSDIPIVGEIETETVALLVLDIAQDGARLEVTSTVCKLDIDSEIKKVRSVVPPAMIEAIGTVKRKARLEKTSDGGIRFFQPKHTDFLGVDPAQKDAALPTEPDDPRVVDADKDGKPGVTVRIEGLIDGAVYVVQRSWAILRGEATSTRMDGAVTWRTQQEVLDASSSLLDSNPDARPHPNRDRHYFRTTKVGSKTTCRDIIKKRGELFDR